jgi:primary-amine oxidase
MNARVVLPLVSVVALGSVAATVTLALPPRPAAASAAQYCRGEQLALGANWSVCWEVRANEGLALTHAFYTRDGFDRRVLSDATVAQIFVPYETGTPRYHDVAYGLGLALQPLDAAGDCPGGTLLFGGRVCRAVEDRGLAGRFCTGGACASRRGKALVLWASSQMGATNYITRWTLRDDGTIEPAVGLAGALQYGDVAHTHSVYWRLDVDIDDPADDRVEEFYRIAPAWGDGTAGASGWVPLLGETYRPNDLGTFRKWRVVDTSARNASNRPWSYELVPSPGSGSLRTTVREAFTRGELWVTRARPRERFVSTETDDLLLGYLDGESIDGEDVVLWYAMHRFHEVRSEDRPTIPLEWMGFELRPRDYFDQNPLD